MLELLTDPQAWIAVKMLALSFLVVVGVVLIAEGFDPSEIL
jgi:predicted tellurium resistance membrane protein TerC